MEPVVLIIILLAEVPGVARGNSIFQYFMHDKMGTLALWFPISYRSWVSQNVLGPRSLFKTFFGFYILKCFRIFLFFYIFFRFVLCDTMQWKCKLRERKKRIDKQAPQHVTEITLFNSHSIPILWNSFPFPSLPHCLDNVDFFTAHGPWVPRDPRK